MMQEGGSTLLRTTATIHVLYLDEGGSVLTAERRCEVSTRADIPSGCTVSVRGVNTPEVVASASASGIEVRFSALFTIETIVMYHNQSLCSLKAEPREDKDISAPSLILRALQPGQRLWDLAKTYRTTVGNILLANELTDESAAKVGEMLLIPRKR